MKAICHKPYGMMKFLLILLQPWTLILMDFIEALPLSHEFDSILIIVDRLTKYTVFIECCTTNSTLQLAALFLKHIFAKHGTPTDIVSD